MSGSKSRTKLFAALKKYGHFASSLTLKAASAVARALAQATTATCEEECFHEETWGSSACNRRSRWRRYGMTKWLQPQKPVSVKTAYQGKAAAI